MKVLVTGGAGFIGSHTVVELQNNGFDVIIVDNLSNSSEDVIDKISQISGIKPLFEKIDLCDEEKTKEFFNKHFDIKAVIHFAAFKAVGESVENPLKYYKNNILSLVNILQNMNNHQINNFVFSSSCTVYGQPDKLPVNEKESIKTPLSPYGNTKQICEEVLIDTINSQNNLKAISLRYFNPIGAHKSSLIGELPLGIPNNLIPYITQTAIGKRKSLNVFGNDYNTSDGTCIRDYIHVVDLAEAHIAALKRLLEDKIEEKLEVYNLGTGIGYSVMDVINSFKKVSGVDLNYQFAPRRSGDVEKVWADASLAEKKLNWKAKKNLDEMLLSAWKWEKNIKI